MDLKRGEDSSSETRPEEARIEESPVDPSRNVFDRRPIDAYMVGRLGSVEDVIGEGEL
jgi:hypothetical protein